MGLITFLDPPRPDTKSTIEAAHSLGVGVKMVTGDQIAIAKETCRMLGMGTAVHDYNPTPTPSLTPTLVLTLTLALTLTRYRRLWYRGPTRGDGARRARCGAHPNPNPNPNPDPDLEPEP